MATTEDVTTLVCLFHHQDQAAAATEDLYTQGIPQASISIIGNESSRDAAAKRGPTPCLESAWRQRVVTTVHRIDLTTEGQLFWCIPCW